MPANYVPKGYSAVTPYLVVPNARDLLDFMKRVFDAQQVEVMETPGGGVMHAEASIGGSIVMVGEASEQWPVKTACLYVYVPDVDATYKRALEAGASSIREPADQFYGDRSGGVRDKSGNEWWMATRKEEVSPEEMQRRLRARYAGGGAAG